MKITTQPVNSPLFFKSQPTHTLREGFTKAVFTLCTKRPTKKLKIIPNTKQNTQQKAKKYQQLPSLKPIKRKSQELQPNRPTDVGKNIQKYESKDNYKPNKKADKLNYQKNYPNFQILNIELW